MTAASSSASGKREQALANEEDPQRHHEVWQDEAGVRIEHPDAPLTEQVVAAEQREVLDDEERWESGAPVRG
jgi:hypothetical protein